MEKKDDYIQEKDKWDRIYASQEIIDEKEALLSFNQEFKNTILQLLPDGGKTIEIGCGAGWQSLALARTGKFDITLLDFSQEALNYSRRLFEREGLCANFILQDAFEQGKPDYDLVFNAGVLEHYSYENQIRLLKSMASRSRRYVLVLVPNTDCYWYWIWRINTAQKSEWLYGKEVPQKDMSTIFKETALNFIGQKYMGKIWTEDFIRHLDGLDDHIRRQILEIHKSNVVSFSHTGYLVAALGSIPGATIGNIHGWDDQIGYQDYKISELITALADIIAINLQLNNQYERKLFEVTREFEQETLRLQQSLFNAEQQLHQIQISRTWRIVQYIWRIKSSFFPKKMKSK